MASDSQRSQRLASLRGSLDALKAEAACMLSPPRGWAWCPDTDNQP